MRYIKSFLNLYPPHQRAIPAHITGNRKTSVTWKSGPTRKMRWSTTGLTSAILLGGLILFLSCRKNHVFKILRQEVDLVMSDSSTTGFRVKNKLTLQFTDTRTEMDSLVFYISPRIREVSVSQGDQQVPFRITGSKLITRVNPEKEKVILLSYRVPYYGSRTYAAGPSHLFILNESAYLPLASLTSNDHPVVFDITVHHPASVVYPVKASRFVQTSRRRPDIIIGRFKSDHLTYKGKTLIFHRPHDLQTDPHKLRSIGQTVFASDSLFGRLLEPLNDTLAIFFVKRTGGHALSSSHLMLDQSYIEQGNPTTPGHVIAHEVAHCWWGHTVVSDNSALIESLAEYYASLYLSMHGKNETLRDFYATKSVDLEIDGYKPSSLENVTPDMGHRYRSLAYKLMPKLYYQLEQDRGRDHMVSHFSKLYRIGRKQRALSGSDLFDVFNDGSESFRTFHGYATGKMKVPNFYIQKVAGNKLTLSSTGQNTQKKIPVDVYFSSGNVIRDTLLLQPDEHGNGLIEKGYREPVSNVIIDPQFTLVQDRISDDTWINLEGRIFSKVPKNYDISFYNFARDYLYYLFSKDNAITPDQLAASPNVKNILQQASANVRKAGLELVAYELFVHEGEHDDNTDFSMYLLFNYQGKTRKGFTNGTLTVNAHEIKIMEIDRLKL